MKPKGSATASRRRTDDSRSGSRSASGAASERTPATSAPASAQSAQPANQPSTATPWSPRRRAVVSVLIALHLAAVFSAPCAGPPPSSPLERNIAGLFEPYLQAAFLNHGYRFFAPNPGPSHLIRYELIDADGQATSGRFPNLSEHQPRLLYHRHFMLSETIFSLTRPITDPPANFTSVEEHEAYERDAKAAREISEPLLTAVARDLKQRHGAQRVKLFMVQHDIPRPDQTAAGMKLDDPSLFREQPLGELTDKETWQWAERAGGTGVELLP